MIKVGITGQNGFIGTHLLNYLGTKADVIDIIPFKRNYFEEEIEMLNFVKTCDVIVHIAALNRHNDPQVVYDINVSLVQKLIKACEKSNAQPKIIFSSSTQEEKDNHYGRSKHDGRLVFEQWAKQNSGNITTLIIPNVFGPFGKPFYNSVVATFCHQVIVGEEPTIHNDATINLIYVNQLSELFYKEIISKENKLITKKKIQFTVSKKVSEILTIIKNFKEIYIDNGEIPNVQKDTFEINLFNTFISYIPKNYFPRKYIKHSDDRGTFVEIMRANISGQSSYSTTVPGITRGNHYHTRKIERFAVIQGKASIKWRKINTREVYEFILNGEEPAYVDMPIWHTHNITNIGNTELITMFWINEPYNADDPDTFFEEV